jgi:hypothetical protein
VKKRKCFFMLLACRNGRDAARRVVTYQFLGAARIPSAGFAKKKEGEEGGGRDNKTSKLLKVLRSLLLESSSL